MSLSWLHAIKPTSRSRGSKRSDKGRWFRPLLELLEDRTVPSLSPTLPQAAATFLQPVSQDATTTVLATAPNPSTYGQAITFTVTVSPAAPGGGVPTGTVSLLFAIRGGLGQVTLNSNGEATLSTSTLAPNTYSVQAIYQGDANFASSRTSYLLQTVLKDATTTTLTSSPNPSSSGQTVTFTATVSANAAGSGALTGSVTFLDDGVSIGSGTLNGGSAGFVASNLAPGTQSITAAYNGSADFAASNSTVLDQAVRSQTMGPASTTTSVSSSADPSVFGQPLTFTASVSSSSPGTPTGTVTFVDGSTVLGTAALNATDKATLTTTGFPVGSQTITAVYEGDANFLTSSGAVVQSVTQDSSTTVLVSSTGASTVFGQLITFSMTVLPVSPGGGMPTGTVTLNLSLRGGLGTATLNTNGVATIATSTLGVGTFTLQAVYNGDANFVGSRSASLTQTVTVDSTTETLTSSLNPSNAGAAVTFSSTVQASAHGSGTPTGTVTFLDGAATLGTKALNGGSASLTTSTLPAGTQSISVVYGGDANFSAGMLPTLEQTVLPVGSSTITTVSSSGSTVSGQSVTFVATVSGAGGTPTGTVIFEDNGTSIGFGSLSDASADTAMFTTARLPTGADTITAVYGGDTNFGSSISPAVSQTVGQASTMTMLRSFVDPSAFGQTVIFTATVTIVSPGSNAVANPTGTVTFYDGGTSIGAGVLSGGATDTATFKTSALSAGTHSITASYGADVNFSASAGGGISGITTLASFDGADGIQPSGGLVEDASGNLFGTTDIGGAANGSGAVFEVGADSGTITTLASFNGHNGYDPRGTLVEDASGNLFGTTISGGASDDGTVFEVSAGSGAITVLASFNGSEGYEPGAGLVEDANGNLFGTTQYGGPNDDGTVYEVGAGSGAITTLAWFNAIDGNYPDASLIEDASGNLFGTTPYGGPYSENGHDSGYGTVFEVHRGSGAITTLASFNHANGSLPVGALVEDASGNLFGTTANGGAGRFGTVFELEAGSGTITDLASFDGTNGFGPSGLVEDGSGNLFGASGGGAFNDGTVFEVAAGSDTITDLASFNGTNGQDPSAALVEARSGNLFGTTLRGGAFGQDGGDGTVFELPAALILIVDRDGTDATLTSSPSESTIDQPVTLTAIVRSAAPGSGTPTDTVTFIDTTAGTTLGTGTLTGGTATLTTSFSTVGTHAVTAYYSGDANFTANTSAVLTQTVSKGSSVTVIASSLRSSVYGQAVTFTATVTGDGGGTPTGSVTFVDATTGVTLGTGTLAAGQATLTTTIQVAAGSESITTIYSGDPNFATSSGTVIQTVSQAASATSFTSSGNSVYGQTITFTSTVSPTGPGAGTPTGTVLVTFAIRGGLGMFALSGGQATIYTSTLVPGTYTIRATYSGDNNFLASTSGTITQTVSKDSTTAILTSSSTNSISTAGQTVTFTVTVSANSPGRGIPTGQAAFLDGTAKLGTVGLSGGTATFTTSSLTPGAHSITVDYAGSADFLASTSATLTQTVNAAPRGTISLITALPVSDPAYGLRTTVRSPTGIWYEHMFHATGAGAARPAQIREEARRGWGSVHRRRALLGAEWQFADLDRFFAYDPSFTGGVFVGRGA